MKMHIREKHLDFEVNPGDKIQIFWMFENWKQFFLSSAITVKRFHMSLDVFILARWLT